MKKIAFFGGKPERKELLPYAQHWVGIEEIDAVGEVLRNKMLTQGNVVDKFEQMFAEYVGAKHAISVSSCTAGLHLCNASIAKKQDEIITTPMSFIATTNSILYANAKPIFADIDKETMNIAPETIEKMITDKTKAIIPVHYGGLPCDMDAIKEIAEKHDLIVIEDAAHAAGAEYKGKKIGSLGHMTCFSFHPAKQMTTGEGGMITTNDDEIAKKLKLLMSHGIDKDFKERVLSNSYHYNMKILGYNYRLSDINAAIGIEQLKKLDSFIKRRKKIALKYNKTFENLPVRTPKEPINGKHAWHLYTLQLKLDELNADRDTIFKALRAENIGINVLYIPIYKHSFYQNLGYKKMENTETIFKRIITLPLFPKMTNNDIDDVIKATTKVIEHFRK